MAVKFKTSAEIEKLLMEVEDEETKDRLNKELHSMGYADGVASALRWILGEETTKDVLNK